MEAALMIPALAAALIYGGGDAAAFVFTIGLTALCGALMSYLLKPQRQDLTARDGMAVAGLSWVILSFFGALPMVFSGAIPHLVDAYFETVSGFTTTGSTILTEIEHLPRGVLFWRSFTHWIGGMGVLVFLLAILPKTDGQSIHLLRAEVPGPTVNKLVPRVRKTARILYLIYLVLTLLECVLLVLGGMSFYEALLHSFATAGTGGFSTRAASIGAFHSVYIETVIAVFMLLFGCNFNLFYLG